MPETGKDKVHFDENGTEWKNSTENDVHYWVQVPRRLGKLTGTWI